MILLSSKSVPHGDRVDELRGSKIDISFHVTYHPQAI
jgi:hypothetical protein